MNTLLTRVTRRYPKDKRLSIQDIPVPEGPAATSSVETTARDAWSATVALHGEVDAAVAPVLRTDLERHLDHGRGTIRIDASDVTFIDSTAIGALVAVAQRCLAERGSLILTNVPTRVRRVIEIAGLESALLIDTASERLGAGAFDRDV